MPKMVKELKWGQDNPIENAPELTEEDKHVIKQRMAVLDKVLAEKKKAKYKIELMFAEKRSTWKPIKGIMSFWESGSKFHGGGDDKIYLCPGKSLGFSDCEAFIPSVANGYGHLLCQKCNKVWKGEQVFGEIIANNTPQNWAKLLLYYYTRLGHNADIYLKHAPDDLRSVAMREQQKQMHGDALQKLRSRRAVHSYPLANIIIDCAAGADLLKRFHAFLVS